MPGPTYHLLPKELEPLTRAHCLIGALYVAKEDVRLSAHFARFHGGDIEDRAVGGEEGIEGAAQVILLEFLGQVLDVERLVGRYTLVGGHCEGY